MNPQRSARHSYIKTDDTLDSLVAGMRKAGRIALDTEGDSLHHYFEKVCLIQLTLAGSNYIVDPLSGIDIPKFRRVLADKRLILHGAEYDLRMLRASTGFRPRDEVFDTMLAAQLLGYEQLGLAALTERFLGVNLTKQGQKSDWSRRPLTQAQIRYAVDDTRYLERLADRLLRELRKLGRLEWHQETCENMVRATACESPQDRENAWRIKGLSLFRPRQLAFVRQIWYWRENESRRADLPPFKIMGNKLILDLAVWAASHPRSPLRHGPKLPRHCTGHRLSALKRAIRKARHLPETKWPGPRKRRRESTLNGHVLKSEVEALRTECSRLADRLGIDPSVLAPRATLAAIARKRPRTVKEIMSCGPLMRWQANLLKTGIKRILGEGK